MKSRTPLIAGLVALFFTTMLNSGSAAGSVPFSLAVIGDTPYGSAQMEKLPGRIDQLSADPDVQVVSHLGDISDPITCSATYYMKVKAIFNRAYDPFVYTPGDNEWADCHRAVDGHTSPLGKLTSVRSVFFPTAGRTLGAHPATVTAQAGYPENVMFDRGGVTLGTIHVVGSLDDMVAWSGLGYTAPTSAQRSEEESRRSADIAHLNAIFTHAKEVQSRGVVLMTQADMFVNTATSAVAKYGPFARAIAAESKSFGKPVLLMNGDTHSFKSDKPLSAGSAWLSRYQISGTVANLARITVEGGKYLDEWVKVTVVPTSTVFQAQRVIFR